MSKKSARLAYYLVCRKSGISLESVASGQPAMHLPGFVRWAPEYGGGEITPEYRKQLVEEVRVVLARNRAMSLEMATGWVVRALKGDKVLHEQQFHSKALGLTMAKDKAEAHYKKIRGMMPECNVELAYVFDCLKEI